jgi:uncharacterized protein (DUF697 family)
VRRILATTAAMLMLSSPCFAQSVSASQWGSIVESIGAARNCGLISYDQMTAAIIASAGTVFGPNVNLTDAYKSASMSGASAGQADALQPGFCSTFPPAAINAIREVAADNGAQ